MQDLLCKFVLFPSSRHDYEAAASAVVLHDATMAEVADSDDPLDSILGSIISGKSTKFRWEAGYVHMVICYSLQQKAQIILLKLSLPDCRALSGDTVKMVYFF